VLAILIGTAVRTARTPGARWERGVSFGAKTLLEVAVVLLGASISLQTLVAVGPGLLAGIARVVAFAIASSYGIGRALRPPRRMAILVACGNSLCGNSAIAAVAPVIGADGEDVASSIAFTAVLGVIVVLALPLAVPLIHLFGMQHGVLAGLTVYAVPQVLAATAPVGVLAVHIGTLVKLVRVLMLGPVVLLLSLFASRLRQETDEPVPHVTAGDRPKPGRIAIHHLVPWFILRFLALAGIRSAGLIPGAALGPIAVVANVLTVLSMAALGLGVDVRRASGGEPTFEGVVCPRERDEEQGVRQGIGQEAASGQRARTGNAFSQKRQDDAGVQQPKRDGCHEALPQEAASKHGLEQQGIGQRHQRAHRDFEACLEDQRVRPRQARR